PWLTARPKALSALRKVLGRSDYRAHEGVNTGGANGVFWLEVLGKRPDGLLIVRNLTEGAKRKVEQVTTVLEPDLVYPLLRGRDVQRWRATPSAHILMVQDPKTRRGIPEEVLQEKYPHTWAYLKRFEPILRQRAAFHRYFTRKSQGKVVETGPFYSMFNVGEYTFSPYKVVWPNIGDKAPAAVISMFNEKLILPQHIITLIALNNLDEAHYICALINSCCFIMAANSYSMHGGKSFGDPHILENIKIPKYDLNNKIHLELANISKKLYLLNLTNHKIKLLEDKIDRLASLIWNITKEEFQDIRWNLADLEAAGRSGDIATTTAEEE
ncbi:MAG: hypothetical protein QXT73_02630, partial [Candidatus Methanomethylicaceae archaeon]